MADLFGGIPGTMPNLPGTLRAVWPIVLPASLNSAQDVNNPIDKRMSKATIFADEICIFLIIKISRQRSQKAWQA
jgi:hypothetical protein